MTAPAITAAYGGITAAVGYRAAGVACGLKPTGLDLALVVSDDVASAAGLFTTNRAVAAPVVVSREQLASSGGHARSLPSTASAPTPAPAPRERRRRGRWPPPPPPRSAATRSTS